MDRIPEGNDSSSHKNIEGNALKPRGQQQRGRVCLIFSRDGKELRDCESGCAERKGLEKAKRTNELRAL